MDPENQLDNFIKLESLQVVERGRWSSWTLIFVMEGPIAIEGLLLIDGSGSFCCNNSLSIFVHSSLQPIIPYVCTTVLDS